MWQENRSSLKVKPPGFSVRGWESLSRTLGEAGVKVDRSNEADVRSAFAQVMRENWRAPGPAVEKKFEHIRHNWQIAKLCAWWGLPKAQALRDEKKTPPPSPTVPKPATPRPDFYIRREDFDKLRAEDAERVAALEDEVRELKRPAARWAALDKLFGELQSDVAILMEERQRRGFPELNGNQPSTGGK